MAALTPLAGSSARSLVLDPMGRILQTTDENGVVTKWTYNPRGQVKTIERAVTKPEDRTTVFNYDCRGDLYRIAPPGGGAGRLLFVYLRHAGAAVAGERHYGCGGLLPSGPASDGASA